jgi:hypothetical protein
MNTGSLPLDRYGTETSEVWLGSAAVREWKPEQRLGGEAVSI